MVFENRADTPLHTESDKEDFLSTMDQPNTTEMSAPDLINEALDEAKDIFPKQVIKENPENVRHK